MEKCDFASHKWKFPVRPAAENVNIFMKVKPDYLHKNRENEISRGGKQSKENKTDSLRAQTNKDIPIGP